MNPVCFRGIIKLVVSPNAKRSGVAGVMRVPKTRKDHMTNYMRIWGARGEAVARKERGETCYKKLRCSCIPRLSWLTEQINRGREQHIFEIRVTSTHKMRLSASDIMKSYLQCKHKLLIPALVFQAFNVFSLSACPQVCVLRMHVYTLEIGAY